MDEIKGLTADMEVGIMAHMKQSTYIKITGLSLTEKIILATRAAQANQSLSAYCTECIRLGKQVHDIRNMRAERKAAAGKGAK